MDISPKESVINYISNGRAKVAMAPIKFFLLSFLGGMFTAFSSALTNTVAHSFTTDGAIRLINGMLFPLGFMMAVLIGAELFLGNNLLIMNVLDKKMKLIEMFKVIFFSYIGNFIGAIFVAYLCVTSRQLDLSSGGLAVFTIKVALGKSGFGFMKSFILGILCNLLVCTGVIILSRSTLTLSRMMLAFLPISIFVGSGYENSIANLYYVPAGIFAKMNERYVSLALEAGLNIELLNWKNFFTGNLIPSSLGNIVGGMMIGVILWYVYAKEDKKV